MCVSCGHHTESRNARLHGESFCVDCLESFNSYYESLLLLAVGCCATTGAFLLFTWRLSQRVLPASAVLRKKPLCFQRLCACGVVGIWRLG